MQPDDEAGAARLEVLVPDLPAGGLHQSLDDCEAEAGSWPGSSRRRLRETVEQVGNEFEWDTVPFV